MALSLALRGPALAGVPPDDQVSSVVTALAVSSRGDGVYLALGHLPYTTAGQFRSAEAVPSPGAINIRRADGRRRCAVSSRWRGATASSLPFQDVTLDRLRRAGHYARTRPHPPICAATPWPR